MFKDEDKRDFANYEHKRKHKHKCKNLFKTSHPSLILNIVSYVFVYLFSYVHDSQTPFWLKIPWEDMKRNLQIKEITVLCYDEIRTNFRKTSNTSRSAWSLLK